MSKTPLLSTSYTPQESPSTLLPLAPLLASGDVNWQGIAFHCYNHSPHEIPLHTLAQHALIITIGSTNLEWQLGNSTHRRTLTDGNIQLIPAHVPYCAMWDRPAHFMVITLDPIRLSKTANEQGIDSSVQLTPQFLNSDALIYGIGQALKTELKSDRSDLLYIESLSNCLVVHLLHRYTISEEIGKERNKNTEGLSQRQLTTVIDYINTHLNQSLSITELAQQIHLSSDYFIRLFRQSTEMTPHRYIVQQRIDLAKQLLQRSHMSINEIALEAGFANQQHFTRQFRQITGTTPKAFRRIAS